MPVAPYPPFVFRCPDCEYYDPKTITRSDMIHRPFEMNCPSCKTELELQRLHKEPDNVLEYYYYFLKYGSKRW